MAAATLRKAKIDAPPLSEVRPKIPFPRKKMSVWHPFFSHARSLKLYASHKDYIMVYLGLS